MVDQLGPTVPKRVAARAIDCSVSTLDRHIAQGHIATATRPGSSRQEIRTDQVVEIARRMRSGRYRQRNALSDAYKPVIAPNLVPFADMDIFSGDGIHDDPDEEIDEAIGPRLRPRRRPVAPGGAW